MYLPLPLSLSTSTFLTTLISTFHLPFLFPEASRGGGTACTFSVGPPGPTTGLCPAFQEYCRKTALYLSNQEGHGGREGYKEEEWSSGCVGGSGKTSTGEFIPGYTVSCTWKGLEMVPTVFPDFLQHELTFDGEGPEIIPFFFVGCQVPPKDA